MTADVTLVIAKSPDLQEIPQHIHSPMRCPAWKSGAWPALTVPARAAIYLGNAREPVEKNVTENENCVMRLEELLAHQTKTIEELSEQLVEQWRVIEQMRARLDGLTLRFLSFEEQVPEAPANARPPHY